MSQSPSVRHVLVVGSGPVAAGPACRALHAAGIRVAVLDPNPATLMVGPEFADATYVAPVTPAGLRRVLAAERPDGLLPTIGGPAALASAIALHENGVLREHGTALLGVDVLAYQRIARRTPRVALGSTVDVELLHDRHGRTAIVGTLEHVDSLTVCPAQTEHEALRPAAVAVVRASAPGAGCCSVRFAVDQGQWLVTGVTPGVSRTSVLAATRRGLAVAELAAMLAVGADLPELPADDGDVLVALGADASGTGRNFLAAFNTALRGAGRPCWPIDDPPPWLAARWHELAELRGRVERAPILDAGVLHAGKLAGLSDDELADLRLEIADGAGIRRIRQRLRPPARGRSAARPVVLLLGSAAGEPAEFDHACANGALALRRDGYRVAVVTAAIGGASEVADRRYLVPLRLEDVLDAIGAEREIGPFAGVLSQLGGPAARALAPELASAGVPMFDAAPVAVDDPATGPLGRSLTGAVALEAVALHDGTEVFLGAVAESIDTYRDRWPESGCVLPAPSVGPRTMVTIRRRTRNLARRHGVRGPLTVRFALLPDVLMPLSVTTGASVLLATASAATGIELAKAGTRLLRGDSIQLLRIQGLLPSAVDPTVMVRLPAGRDAVLGLGDTVGGAFADARAAAGMPLPLGGTVLVSVSERDLRGIVAPVRELAGLGFHVLAGPTTAAALRRHGVDCTTTPTQRAADLVIATGDPTAEPHCLRTVDAATAAVAAIAAQLRGTPAARPVAGRRVAPPRTRTG